MRFFKNTQVRLRSLCKTRHLSLLLLLALGLTGTVQAANLVTATRIWPAQDYTRITLEANQAFVYKMTAMKNPDRVVLDIENIDLNSAVKSLSDKIQASDPYIKQIRAAKSQQGIRVVVDLKATAKPNAFTLVPTGTYKYRLVLDVHPMIDPLMEMLAEREAAKSPENTAPALDLTMQIAPQATTAVAPTPDQAENVTLTSNESALISSSTLEQNSPQEQAATKNNNPQIKKVGRQIIVAIDPGHGGEDPGALGATGSREKDITLMVAKKLKQQIDNEPNMRAVLTRDGDYFIPLHGRVVKARNMQADLFVSIHADAFTNQSARGSSVFALSERGATSASARYLAKKENESDLIGGVSLNDKEPMLARTLLDLSQDATIKDSLKLGKAVLSQIGEINKLHTRHIEQAAFAVLKSPDIPSILIETAFISNPEEERRLNDESYQDQLVASILTGIKMYFATNPALAKSKIALE
ncbi:MAG: N-acetylmuramoyl-L-alanine amidase [Methylotenera sp.]|nr:N-acetylmuramoyl-L-alanine amidase [Methylotenera sp.]MSP99074.1 N-acetylmuramoyl-L-alanine amidase [Methylotenera sp.]